MGELIAAIQEFIDVHNKTGKPYVWVKSADQILASIARFAQRTLAGPRGVINFMPQFTVTAP